MMEATAIDKEIDVNNIYMYISDAVRWSSLPDRVKKQGLSFKTVAAGCATMKSVSSIVSGVYPPKHGVHTWRDRITVDTLFDTPDVSTGFYNPAAGEHGGLNQVLNQQSEDALSEIPTPFFFLERDQGGHAPYQDYTYEEMIQELAHERSELRTYYEEAIEQSITRFDRRLETLSDRGLLDDTLVIYLSDYGELLGEYGLVSHSSPIVPELVYVPTVLIHPGLPQGVQSDVIGHVDFAPTILSALGLDFEQDAFDGVNLFSARPEARYTEASHHKQIRGRRFNVFYATSIWNGTGGHVFNHRGKTLSPLIGYLKANGWNRAYWKANPTELPAALSRYLAPHIEYGTPEMSKSAASGITKEIQQSQAQAERVEISDSVQDRLEDLGTVPNR